MFLFVVSCLTIAAINLYTFAAYTCVYAHSPVAHYNFDIGFMLPFSGVIKSVDAAPLHYIGRPCPTPHSPHLRAFIWTKNKNKKCHIHTGILPLKCRVWEKWLLVTSTNLWVNSRHISFVVINKLLKKNWKVMSIFSCHKYVYDILFLSDWILMKGMSDFEFSAYLALLLKAELHMIGTFTGRVNERASKRAS